VFVIATANRIENLPPELLRKGRFDEIFFVDLPSPEERREIFDIHLRRRKRDPGRFDLAELSRRADNFSGAEIEQVVVEGLYHAFAESKELEQPHLLRALGETMPLATTMKEDIARLQQWAKTRTRPASPGPDEGEAASPASRFA
jgi:SpoVK/Ycf46/Vps4 family AAA+-type ATPase